MKQETIAPTPPIITATVTKIAFYMTLDYRLELLNIGNELEVLDPQPERPTSKGIWAKTDKNVVVFLDEGEYTLTITGKIMQFN